MAGMVAASGPGDLAYGLRIAAERIPARLAPSAETRARAELGIANRRLADLDRTMRSQDQDARRADGLCTAGQRRDGSGDGHQPARAGAGRDRRSHRRASATTGPTQAIAHRVQSRSKHCRPHPGELIAQPNALGAGPISPTPQPAGPLHEPIRRPSATPHGAVTPSRTPSPHLPAAETASPTPEPSASPKNGTPGDAGRQQATPQARRHGHGWEEYAAGNICASWSDCNLPRSRPGCDFARSRSDCNFTRSRPGSDFARSRTRRDLPRSRSGRDLARTRTHFTEPRTGFTPWSPGPRG